MNGTGLLLDCVAAVLGGCLGAALSALGGFLLFGLLGVLGFAYLLMAHSGIWINAVTGTELLHPGVCFVGGVVATAYARKKGLVQCGKDIGRSFIACRRPDILVVGGCAGLAGSLVNRGLAAILAGRVDTIAVTVFLIPLCLKYAWHMTRSSDCEASSHAVPSPYRFFERFSRPLGRTLLALCIGSFTGLITCILFSIPDTRPYAGYLMFFVSAVFLFPLFMGIPVPATHHFSGPAGAVTALWLSLQAGVPGGAGLLPMMLWAGAAAQAGLLAGNVLEKLLFTEGDIHIDPPAMGIMVSTAIMLGVFPLTGIYSARTGIQIAVSASLIAAIMVLNLRPRQSSRSRVG